MSHRHAPASTPLSRATMLFLRGHLGLLLLLGALVPVMTAQQMPFVVQAPDGAMHIWTVDEPTGMAVPEIDDVTFLPIQLAGHSSSDRLRVDRPRLEGVTSPAPHIQLPRGGALYRVQSGVETGLLRVAADGTPELILSIPSHDAGPSVQEAVFVSPDGRTVAVATEFASGGDVILLRLDETADHYVITANEPPLRVVAETLRASTRGAWFVASDELHRAKPADTRTEVVEFDLLRAVVLPDLVMNEWGTRVATVVRYEHKDSTQLGDRHVFAVDISGPATRVTDRPSDYDLPSVDATPGSGPLMALNQRGDRIAFRRASKPDEVLARRITPLGKLLRVRGTIPDGETPATPVQSIRFADADQFWFIESGAGAWTCLMEDQEPIVAAFEIPVGLQIDEAIADPTGKHVFITASRHSSAAETYEVYEADPLAPQNSPTRLIKGLRVRPRFVALGSSVVVISGRPSGGPPEDAADIELHVELIERTLPQQPPMLMLFPDQAGVELSRFAVSPTGRHASFVAGSGLDFVMPTYIDLRTGGLRKASKASMAVSPVLAFSSSGSLLVGLSQGHGGYTFGCFKTPLDGAKTALPKSYGFPLQH